MTQEYMFSLSPQVWKRKTVFQRELYSHHPTPTGFDPCHTPQLEIGRRAQLLISDCGNGDSSQVGLVDGDCLVIIQSANLPVGDM